VRGLIGPNPFEKSEEQLIKEYNSSVTLPLVLFLGLDERKKEGFEHGIYKGQPFFAVDITPRGTVEKEASAVVEAMKAKGLSFIEGRMHMSLNAPEGMGNSANWMKRYADSWYSCNLCSGSCAP